VRYSTFLSQDIALRLDQEYPGSIDGFASEALHQKISVRVIAYGHTFQVLPG
jgi:hypothetical protein